MQRIPLKPRKGLAAAAARHEFSFDGDRGVPFWDETACYKFDRNQISEDLKKPAEEIEGMCFDVVEMALNEEEVLIRLGIDEQFWQYLADSWKNQEKNLYGRMDFSYDAKSPAKLIEYNADTPTILYESSVFQWEWLEEAIEEKLIPKSCDQFNDIHDEIVKAFSLIGFADNVHLAANQDLEDDSGTLDYVRECAEEAGLTTSVLSMEDIGINEDGAFTDLSDNIINVLFKLYPWEWIMKEEFGSKLLDSGVQFVEPPWRAILSNKGMLPLLWKMFEGHPNLLPAFFEGDPSAEKLGGTYVRKPLFSRQGANVEIFQDNQIAVSSGGPYGDEGHILQAFHPLPEFAGRFPLIGCWLIASTAVGIGIREDTGLITSSEACFVPHIVLDG